MPNIKNLDIDVFKQNKNIDKTDEAVEELVDIELAASRFIDHF